MMRIAVLSDAHANHIAVEACLKWINSHGAVDRIVFLGDAVGYYFGHNRVIARLRKVADACLLGNHDACVTGHSQIDQTKEDWYLHAKTRSELSDENLQFLRSLSPTLEMNENGARMLFVHGSPCNPLDEYVYPDSNLEKFESLSYDIIFMGHTHRPFVRQTNSKIYVNVGSCGMPRDHGALASFAVFDTVSNAVEILRLKLDTRRMVDCFSPGVHSDVLGLLGRVEENYIGKVVDYV